MRLNKKKKEKIINALITSIFFIAIASILLYIWYDHKNVKQHLQECKQICHPDEVIENLSNKLCVCKKVLKIEDTI